MTDLLILLITLMIVERVMREKELKDEIEKQPGNKVQNKKRNISL